jgi:hypothetical protein
MLYWTGGSDALGQVFYFEFDGAVPQPPILVSGTDGVGSVFGFSSEDRLYYLTANESLEGQAIKIVDIVDGEGPTPAVQVSEPLEPGYSLKITYSEEHHPRIAYAARNDEHSWLSLLDLSFEQPSPWHVYDSPFGYDLYDFPAWITPRLPKYGHIMPFVAYTGPDRLHLFSMDLCDPDLAVTQLDTALPSGWSAPASLIRFTPEESQVVFYGEPPDNSDVYMRVPVDGSGPIEPLHDLGWEWSNAAVLTAP